MRNTAEAVLAGAWFVEPLRRGYKRRPHLYAEGSEKSACARGWKPKKALTFDYGTSETVEIDSTIGERQFRRPCGMCEPIYTSLIQRLPVAEGYASPESLNGDVFAVLDAIREIEFAGFVITRVIGTGEDGTARFEVDTTQATAGVHLSQLVYMFTRTADRVAFLDREPTADEDQRPNRSWGSSN